MKKGQIAEGNVTTVEFPNKGIVMTDEGERVIVKNTIPGHGRPQIPAGISDSAEDVRIRVCLMKNS